MKRLYMATVTTQNLIIETAIKLFNEHGTKAVSTNRIADVCSISRGLLHYHFKNKEDIIQTIFSRIDQEMDNDWYDDHKHPTIKYARFMFERQIELILRYSFFYRELYPLLRKDEKLKTHFRLSRKKRETEVRSFFDELIRAGLMVQPKAPASLDSLLRISWLISDQWLLHLELTGVEADASTIREGFSLIYQGFEPFFTPEALAEYQASLAISE